MPKKSLLLSAIFFDCLGKAAVFCVHKLKEKVRDPLPTVWRNRLRGWSPLSLCKRPRPLRHCLCNATLPLLSLCDIFLRCGKAPRQGRRLVGRI